MSIFRKSVKKSDAILLLLLNLYKEVKQEEIIIDDSDECATFIGNFLSFVKTEILEPLEYYFFDPSYFDKLDEKTKELIKKLSHEKIYKDDPNSKVTRLYYGATASSTQLSNIKTGMLQKINTESKIDWESSITTSWKEANFDKILLSNKQNETTVGEGGYVIYHDLNTEDIKLNLGNISKNLKIGLEKIFKILEKLAAKYDVKSHKSLTDFSFIGSNKSNQYEPDDFSGETEKLIPAKNVDMDSEAEKNLRELKRSITNATKVWVKNFETFENLGNEIIVNDDVKEGIVHSFYFFDQENKLHVEPPTLLKDQEFKEFLKNALNYITFDH